MPVSTIVLLVIVAIGALWYVTKGKRAQLATRSAVAALPVMSAQTVDGAAARTIGTVRMLEQLVAPLSGRPCVAYRTVCNLKEAVATHTGAVYPGEVVQEQSAMFALDRPGDTSILVDGSHVRLDMPSLPFSAMDGAKREAFLSTRGISIRYAQFADWSEQIVEVGSQIAIAGTVMHDAGGPGEMYRDGSTQVRMSGNAQFPLMITRA